MWCVSHVLYHISCTAWCRSHTCIKGSQFYSLQRHTHVGQCMYSAGYCQHELQQVAAYFGQLQNTLTSFSIQK
jgi:hypothetical protein